VLSGEQRGERRQYSLNVTTSFELKWVQNWLCAQENGFRKRVAVGEYTLKKCWVGEVSLASGTLFQAHFRATV
jgi:hypothetical protein